MTFPKTGARAPLFTLDNQHGTPVSLKDFKGKKTVVLYFYPAAMTSGCTVQACGLRDAAGQLQQLQAVALGVSPDPLRKLQKFVERDQLNFDLLSDPNHAVADLYGAWGPKKFMGRAYDGILRATFIIDKTGVLRQVMSTVKTKTHHDDVLKLLRSLD